MTADLLKPAIAAFNRQNFFECHELLEDIWQPMPAGPLKTLYHAMIQLSVAFVHFKRSNYTGMINLLNRSLENFELSGFETLKDNENEWSLLDLVALQKQAHQVLAEIQKLGPGEFSALPDELIPRIEYKKPPA